MRSRPFITIAALLGILLAGGVGTILYDHSRRDTIAEGVTVAGVDVGGLSAAQAKAKLEREYVAKLRAPVVVHHDRKRFVLTAAESKVAADVGGMVEEALAASREGNALGRTWRGLTGGKVDAAVAPVTTYSKASTVRLLDRIRRTVDRPAKDASISFTADGVQTVPSHDGLAVMATQLHRQIRRAILDPSASHALVARTEHVAPKLSTDALARENQTVLIVNRGAFRLKLFKNLKLEKTYEIAVGKIGLDTPAGLYHIQNKAINPAWTKPHSDWVPEDERGTVVPGGTTDNPLKARWMGIFDGAGIHGIDPSEYGSIGHAASHGCVRMRIPDVEELYDQVEVGAPIYIA
jgi:hypothetical protein